MERRFALNENYEIVEYEDSISYLMYQEENEGIGNFIARLGKIKIPDSVLYSLKYKETDILQILIKEAESDLALHFNNLVSEHKIYPSFSDQNDNAFFGIGFDEEGLYEDLKRNIFIYNLGFIAPITKEDSNYLVRTSGMPKTNYSLLFDNLNPDSWCIYFWLINQNDLLNK